LKRTRILILLIAVILIIDQWLKIHIKTTYALGGGFEMFGLDWARIHFIENKGMAFGMEFGGMTGKYILSIFRIIMVFFLAYFLHTLIKAKEAFGLQVSFALIIAGAIGNIIDSMFYGLIFSKSKYHGGVAEFLPEGGGYAGFLQGWVVDMFHFPMFRGYFPEWFPYWGGDPFVFFRPVFNVADSAISIGVVLILLFHKSYFISKANDKAAMPSPSDITEDLI